MKTSFLRVCVFGAAFWLGSAFALGDESPNVIFILTDDQGSGDLGCHGNPWIQTPHLDQFYEESVRLTDFHVSPVCTPTRAALMTGRYPINNGAWATYKGRDSLSKGAITMAEVFRRNGYRTGIFGKWHLGDNYPVRASDCGFEMAVHHKSGGVGELSDYWGNNYFDDVYFVNNEPKQFEGYCTDIWFEEAMKFIGEVREQPFFVYIPTNAPHGPLYVSDKYAEPYRDLVGERIFSAEFYGMITNIDENFGKLEAYLQKEGLADNTLLIFSTDNGTGAGMSRNGLLGYNHGLRGKKGHRTEGGHRVPFFIRWKDGKLAGGRDVDEVAAHVDVLPTLVKLCGLKMPEDLEIDGVDLSPLLRAEASALPSREVFVHNRQDWRPPMDVDASCIIRGKWRLVDGSELYNVAEDRMQRKNLASQYPEVVSEMLKSNAQFVASAKLNTEYAEFPASVIGSEHQAEVKLTIQHAIGEDAGFWKCEQVATGLKNRNNTHSIEIEREGVYRISFRRWPVECSGPIRGIPEKNPKGGMFDYKAISPEKARLSIVNQVWEKPVGESEHEIVFEINLEPGKTFLVNDFIEGREAYGVYYTYVQYLGE